MHTRSGSVRILVIDQRPIVRAALESLIAARTRFEIVPAGASVSGSLERALQDSPDAVVLSVGSSAHRAFTVLASLRQATPPIRTLLLTEAADRDLHHDAIRMGAYGVISPESPADTLIKALDCVCRGEYWIDRATAAALAQPSRGAQPGGNGGSDRFGTLTGREREIVVLIGDGLRNKEISQRLSISETTVRHHLTSIFSKLDVADRLALVVYAFRHGLVSAPSSSPAARGAMRTA
jgi:two-component system nitrate/nitrite response regulator NarL